MAKFAVPLQLIALHLLRENLHEWRDKPDAQQIWRSAWPVFERMIVRHNEMVPVYDELANFRLNKGQVWNLLEQLIFAGSFGTEDNYEQLRSDYHELCQLNEDIQRSCCQLAAMLERQSEILNHNSFICERMTSITELMAEAGRYNGHYTSWLHRKLEILSHQYDGKYWPKLSEILQVAGEEDVEICFMDESTEAIINARRASLTDYFRELFDYINQLKQPGDFSLPLEFRFSDSALATIANITRDLEPEKIIDAVYVKRTRHRLKEQGFSAVM